MNRFKLTDQKKFIRKCVRTTARFAIFAAAAAVFCAISNSSKYTLSEVEIEAHAETIREAFARVNAVNVDTEVVTVDSMQPSTAASLKETQPATEELVEEMPETTTEMFVTESTYNYSGDVELLASVIYLESGSCSEYCQWLVGSAIMNLADANGGLDVVAHDYNMFEVAPDVDSCEPSELSTSVAQRVLSGDRDYAVNAFREGYYHEWATPYTNVDNVYFSTF